MKMLAKHGQTRMNHCTLYSFSFLEFFLLFFSLLTIFCFSLMLLLLLRFGVWFRMVKHLFRFLR